jgi:ipoprotein LpqH
MHRRYIAPTLLLLMGIAGCSSPPPALKLPNGALPSGTAQITVDGNATGPLQAVACQSIGTGLTEINIGTTGTGTTVLVDSGTPKGVTFNDVEGFTGSYWQDLQGSAQLGMVDQTYTLTGTAAGFNTEHPYTRTMNDFTVKVAC